MAIPKMGGSTEISQIHSSTQAGAAQQSAKTTGAVFDGYFSTSKTDDEPSDAKVATENFKDDIMSKLDMSKATRQPKVIRYYLNKLVQVAQELNGVQKNHLEPNGTAEQNRIYNNRIKEKIAQMNAYVEDIGSGLGVVQDSKTGLYKLSIDNKLYDIPERKVELGEETVNGIELTPHIVD